MIPDAKWTTSVEKVSDTEYDLVAIVKVPSGFHLYSQNIDEDGPIPTSFIFNDNDDYTLVGNTKEGTGITEDDKVFEMEIKYFSDKAVFKQRISLLKESTTIEGLVEFMMCNDTQCSQPTEVDLSFKIPEQVTTTISDINGAAAHKETVKQADHASTDVPIKDKSSQKSLLAIFIIAFFSGFAALLTPCVFPMIPMTVSFFTKQSKSKAAGIKNAIIYGLSIIVIYVLLGTVVSAVFGASALNALASNVWFNLIFFLLLIIFAVSFLGAFEIMLPNSWANKVDSQADRGGLIGIFFMALALAIVSFSCTGPIVGTLLVEAASGGNQSGPIIGMLGFSLAIALPFALFAAFPGWLNSLPKSGGWLNTVKVVLGFLELALAFKFLSNADLVLQLHLFEREIFLAIWIAIFGVLALYLFGKIQLPHDSPLTHISVGRLSLGLLSLAFTIYMIPGLWGAPLNLISAFPPPYSESPSGVGFTGSSAHVTLPDGAHFMEGQGLENIVAFKDYDKGLAYAKKVGKPVMIDFTGHTCVNCRKMEKNVWAKQKITDILENDIVVISLYVDDKRPLPENEVRPSKAKKGKMIKDIGDKWSELQTIRYKANSQPYYVLMDHNEENLIDPVAYTPDVNEYYDWLKTGVSKFKK